jgi:glycerol kinase
VKDTGGVTLVPAFVGLGAPYWDSEARGAILGMTRGSNRAHLVRAALEAIAFQTADLLRAMRQDMGRGLRELRVDGGVTANDFLMEFMADLLGIPVRRPAMLDMTAFGAARLAAVANGRWRALPAGDHVKDRTFRPRLPQTARRHALASWKSAVARVRSGA